MTQGNRARDAGTFQSRLAVQAIQITRDPGTCCLGRRHVQQELQKIVREIQVRLMSSGSTRHRRQSCARSSFSFTSPVFTRAPRKSYQTCTRCFCNFPSRVYAQEIDGNRARDEFVSPGRAEGTPAGQRRSLMYDLTTRSCTFSF